MADDDSSTAVADVDKSTAFADSDTGGDSNLQTALSSDDRGLASLAQPSDSSSSSSGGQVQSSISPSQGGLSTTDVQQAAQQQEPLKGLGGRLRGVLYGLATGGIVGGAAGAIAPNTVKNVFERRQQGAQARVDLEKAQAQQAQQNIQFESVRAADTHILASKQADHYDAATEEARAQVRALNDAHEKFLTDEYGILPDLQLEGNGQEVHDQATAGLQTLANENGGQIPPVAVNIQPHTADQSKFKVGVYAPSQQDLQKNQAGYRQVVDDARAVQGLPPIDDTSWNTQGFKGQRLAAQGALQFLSPTPEFSKENIGVLLAQKKQQLAAYQQHTDASGNSDAKPSVVANLQRGVQFLTNAKADIDNENIQSEVAKQNALAQTPTGKLNTALKLIELKKANQQADKTMGYADINGQTVYTSKQQATDAGAPFEEEKPGDVNKDRQAMRQLNDVQLNTSRYTKAAQTYASGQPLTYNGQPVSAQNPVHTQGFGSLLGIDSQITDPNELRNRDNTNFANLMTKAGWSDVEASISAGGHISVPVLSKFGQNLSLEMQSQSYKELSDQGKALFDGYVRTMAAIPAYQKALTGIGRSNKEMLDLELANIGNPTLPAQDIVRKQSQFQENIDRATEGFPVNLPGIKNPKQTRAEVEGAQQSQQQQQPVARYDPMTRTLQWVQSLPGGNR